ncbi:hypothetical protein K501DRAFT_322401 [Backusella circina FSU 941]|nr:hypothetical protein K501DRAFT_322401 [Backusella circina FSU 941]
MYDRAFYMDMNHYIDRMQLMATVPKQFPEITLVDIKGNRVDVKKLASEYHLILITLKNTNCPVCPQLLRILNMFGLDPDTNSFVDPFIQQEFTIDPVQKQYFELLLKKDAYFIIICPGTNSELAEIQQTTPFLEYPFIGGDQALSIAKALELYYSDNEIKPAILEVSKDTLIVQLICGDRGPGRYYHRHLLSRLIELRREREITGILCLREGQEVIGKIKRKITKCQQGKLAPASLLVSPRASKPDTTKFESNFGNASDNNFPNLHVKHANNTSCGTLTNVKDDAIQHSFLPTPTAHVVASDKFANLPLEILEVIFSHLKSDIKSLVNVTGVCRVFYIAACNVIIFHLRNQMSFLELALPRENGKITYLEDDIASDKLLERPKEIGYRELQQRVADTQKLLIGITQWSDRWSPRKIKRFPRNV